MQSDYRDANAVFLAQVVSVQLHSYPDGNQIESGALKVIEAWKGPHRVGDLVAFRSNVSPGGCGVSVINRPVWVETIDPATHATTTPPIKGNWVIYAYGVAPYEVGHCTRSRPVDLDGSKELKLVRELAERLKAGNSADRPSVR
jgi:hypothetical protein